MGEAADHVRDVLKERAPGSGEVKALAHALGLHASTVYNWRSGARGVGPDDLVALARYFKISTDELLGLKPLPPVNLDAVDRRLARAHEAAEALAAALGEARSMVAGEVSAEPRQSPGKGSRPR